MVELNSILFLPLRFLRYISVIQVEASAFEAVKLRRLCSRHTTLTCCNVDTFEELSNSYDYFVPYIICDSLLMARNYLCV